MINHRWNKEDDIVAFYLYKFGKGNLSRSIEGISNQLGMSSASMMMRISNFEYLDKKKGLKHYGKIIFPRLSVPSHFSSDFWLTIVLFSLHKNFKKIDLRLYTTNKYVTNTVIYSIAAIHNLECAHTFGYARSWRGYSKIKISIIAFDLGVHRCKKVENRCSVISGF